MVRGAAAALAEDVAMAMAMDLAEDVAEDVAMAVDLVASVVVKTAEKEVAALRSAVSMVVPLQVAMWLLAVVPLRDIVLEVVAMLRALVEVAATSVAGHAAVEGDTAEIDCQAGEEMLHPVLQRM